MNEYTCCLDYLDKDWRCDSCPYNKTHGYGKGQIRVCTHPFGRVDSPLDEILAKVR